MGDRFLGPPLSTGPGRWIRGCQLSGIYPYLDNVIRLRMEADGVFPRMRQEHAWFVGRLPLRGSFQTSLVGRPTSPSYDFRWKYIYSDNPPFDNPLTLHISLTLLPPFLRRRARQPHQSHPRPTPLSDPPSVHHASKLFRVCATDSLVLHLQAGTDVAHYLYQYCPTTTTLPRDQNLLDADVRLTQHREDQRMGGHL